MNKPRKTWIVIAWIDMTGLRATSALERFDGVNWRPRVEPAPEAKAVVWARGTEADLANARKYAAAQISATAVDVFTFPLTEHDPLGAARTRILETFQAK